MNDSEPNAKNELNARDIHAHKVVVGTSIDIYSGPARDRVMMTAWLRQLADIHRETASSDEIDATLRRIEGAIGLYEGTNQSQDALDTFRTVLAVGLARWDLYPEEGRLEKAAPYIIPSLLGEALWQIVLIRRLPDHWLETLRQITSPAVALWISNVRTVIGKHNEQKWRIELTRHLTSAEWQGAVQRLLDDLSNPAGGAPVVEEVLQAQRRASREAIRDRRSLLLVILSAAGAGVIGNRADALVVRLVDQALKSLTPQPAPPSTAPAMPDPGSTSSKSNRPAIIEVLTAPGVKMPLVRVPAGPFLMGSDKAMDSAASDDELPQHRVYLSEFLIGRFPVTVAEFAAFVQAKRYVTEVERAGGDTTWRAPHGKGSSVARKADHPVTHVTWADANAFCAWLSSATGRRVGLPTEAQWEKAARGTDGRIYPWGNTFDDHKANSRRNRIVSNSTPVGAFSANGGDSIHGCADMAGNVLEWCADWYSDAEYRSRVGLSAVRDPLGPRTGTSRVLRGGLFFDDAMEARCASRDWNWPYYFSDLAGFRVVVSSPFSSL